MELTDEAERVLPFQRQFDKLIASQVKIAKWNLEKDLLAMVKEDSNGRGCGLNRLDTNENLSTYEDRTSRIFPPAPVPQMYGLISGDTNFTDDSEDSFTELSNSSQQRFSILCSGDKDGSICFSRFGIFFNWKNTHTQASYSSSSPRCWCFMSPSGC